MEINLTVKLDKLSEAEHKYLNRWGRHFRNGTQDKDTAAYRLYQTTDSSKNRYGYSEATKKLTITSVPFNCYIQFKMYMPSAKYRASDHIQLTKSIYDDVVKANSRNDLAKAILDILGAPDELYDKIANEANPVSAYVSTYDEDTNKGRYESMSTSKNFW
jgi:hypothetical protein